MAKLPYLYISPEDDKELLFDALSLSADVAFRKVY